MRVAQVAPLYESVPPQLYGGTERVVSYLTEELVSMGHEVTLFASGDSVTRATLAAMCPRALRLDPGCVDGLARHLLMVELVAQQAANFDVIHYHCDYLHFSLSRRSSVPHITTLHGRLDIKDLRPLYREFARIPLVSISNAQRAPLPQANWFATVHHGLPTGLYQLHAAPGNYLAFVGRISPEKGVDRAIEIATRSGVPLRIGGKIDRVDEAYFKEVIEPLLRNPLVEFVGEINDAAKNDFLGNALATLAPIEWPEPFGLVMIESMACGTPVIAFARGSVPEIVEDGVTGFKVRDTQSAVRAVEEACTLDRAACRAEFDRRFTVDRMAEEYLAIYEYLLTRGESGHQAEKPKWMSSSG